MDESLNGQEKKQTRPKPPLNRARIAREIVAGMAAGFAGGLAVAFGFIVLMMPIASDKGCYAGYGVLAGALLFVFPAAYGLGSAIGVYLVGRTGKQTGSFFLTLGCGILGGLGAIAIGWSMLVVGMTIEVGTTIGLLFLLIIPPILATLGFNLTRRYKELPSS